MYIKIALITLVLSVFVSAQDNNAMFGLKWGMSPQQISAMGITLNKTGSERNFSHYTTDSLPKNLSYSESFSLIFDENSLVKMKMVSVSIEGDLFGTEGKKLFDRTIEMLSKSYKVGQVFCRTGLELYKDENEFYECLAYEGCGFWVTGLTGGNKQIVVKLEGLKRGGGYLTITVESLMFSKSLEKYEKLKESSDSKAFE